jgi:hypothetical protein
MKRLLEAGRDADKRVYLMCKLCCNMKGIIYGYTRGHK